MNYCYDADSEKTHRLSLALSSGPWVGCVCMAWGSEGEASKEEEEYSSIWHVLCDPRRARITLSHYSDLITLSLK